METVKMIEASMLVPLGEFSPREERSEAHILSLEAALRGGAELPPLLVCKKTNRVVDGAHRWRAYVRAYGEDVVIPCLVRVYASEADLFADAIRENAKHGLRLSASDQDRCVHLAERLKITAENLAPLLQVSAGNLKWRRVSLLSSAQKVTAPSDEKEEADDDRDRPAAERPWRGPSVSGPGRRRPAKRRFVEKDEPVAPPALSAPSGRLEPKDKVNRAIHYAQSLTLLLDNKLLDANLVALLSDMGRLKLAINGFLQRGQQAKAG